MSNKESRGFETVLLKVGSACVRLDKTIQSLDDEDTFIKGLVFRPPDDENREWLVVVRAMRGGHNVVAFHRAEMFVEAVKGISDRLNNRSVVWKDDQYA